MSQTLVKDYYTGFVHQEWRRLIRDAYHRLEFETTLYFLRRHFPRKRLILDAGGGPGRYTLTLAGHASPDLHASRGGGDQRAHADRCKENIAQRKN